MNSARTRVVVNAYPIGIVLLVLFFGGLFLGVNLREEPAGTAKSPRCGPVQSSRPPLREHRDV